MLCVNIDVRDPHPSQPPHTLLFLCLELNSTPNPSGAHLFSLYDSIGNLTLHGRSMRYDAVTVVVPRSLPPFSRDYAVRVHESDLVYYLEWHSIDDVSFAYCFLLFLLRSRCVS